VDTREDQNAARAAFEVVGAQRVTQACGGLEVRDESVAVVVESRLTIDVERVESYGLVCTPCDRKALVAGFLLSEGLIDSMADVATLQPCETDPTVVRVRLAGTVPRIGDTTRNLLIVSSCGACGSDDLEQRMAALPKVGDTLRLDSRLLQNASAAVRQRQTLFDVCGGSHAAGVFDRSGRVIACAEDVGRHNALDKAIGNCLLAGARPAGCGVTLSGRVSLEMVGKAARAGIEVISAVSAPTSLAIAVAEACNITLCAFVREDRATVFTHARRVLGCAGAAP
jgi:FdhD protein